jgi:hypothetical protein
MRRTPFIVMVLIFCFVVSRANQAANDRFSAWGAPVNLGPIVNSPAIDQTPEMSKDGLSLYFSSMRPGGLGSGDLWVSQRSDADAPWGTPRNLGPMINSGGNEGAPHLSRDGHHLFFASSRGGSMDIWLSWRAHVHDDFGWEAPVRIDAPVSDSAAFEGGTWLLGREMYLASDRLSPGLLDIFVAFVRGDGTVTSLAPVSELNTAANDVRPSVRWDGREMFIASNRPGGLGMADVWVSTRRSRADAWSLPQNLGPGINTASNDAQAAISSDGLTLLFNSDRGGNQDLYMAVRELRGP